MSLRDNLLVTAGSRIAYMDCQELIDIPGGSSGEDEIAEFIVIAVDSYIDAIKTKEVNFDEFIETVIAKQYG